MALSKRARSDGLSREALEKLLEYLDGDRERASEKYRDLQRKLIALFEWRSCSAPEELADETLNRVARKLEQGLEIKTREPFRYLRGVALNLVKEDYKRAVREREAFEDYRHQQTRQEAGDESDERKAVLDRCLAELESKERALILNFYQGEKSTRIANRRRQAEELGISRTALRIRAHRLRKLLEKCVKKILNP